MSPPRRSAGLARTGRGCAAARRAERPAPRRGWRRRRSGAARWSAGRGRGLGRRCGGAAARSVRWSAGAAGRPVVTGGGGATDRAAGLSAAAAWLRRRSVRSGAAGSRGAGRGGRGRRCAVGAGAARIVLRTRVRRRDSSPAPTRRADRLLCPDSSSTRPTRSRAQMALAPDRGQGDELQRRVNGLALNGAPRCGKSATVRGRCMVRRPRPCAALAAARAGGCNGRSRARVDRRRRASSASQASSPRADQIRIGAVCGAVGA